MSMSSLRSAASAPWRLSAVSSAAASESWRSPMPAYERIQCPVDFSEFSKCALAFAGSIASRHRSKLFAQHVVEVQHNIEAGFAMAAFYAEYREFLKTSGEESLAKFLNDNSAANLQPTRVVSEGLATDAILSLAAAESIDLIVMGTHGRRGLDRFLIGSVTERVVRKAACPVLTVHGRAAEFAEAGRLPTTHGGKVLLCTDLSDRSRRAFDDGWLLAAEYGGELTLVHVLDTGSMSRSIKAPLTDAWNYLKTLPLPEGCSLPPSNVVVRVGRPYEQIIALATEGVFDVVVMSARGEGVRDPAVFGSTTHRVIQLGPCPVLVVPS
jgi:nucleotide-binding universal stress UspA family protein